MTDKSKFRPQALKELSSPDQLDQLIQVVTPRSWQIAITIYAIILAILIWSIVGTIPTRVEGSGILLAGGGDIYNAVAPEGPSRINAILVKGGEEVTKGQVVAKLTRPDLETELRVNQGYLTNLQQKKSVLVQTSTQDVTARKQELQNEKESLQRALAAANEKFKHQAEFLALRQAAFKRGIETRQNVEQTLEEYYSIKSEIEGYTNRLIQIDIDQANFIDQWRERLRDLDLKITAQQVKNADIQSRIKFSANVTSPIAGTVTSAQAEVGTVVNTGAPVVAIASQGQGLDALIYLPPQHGKRVKAGMAALVSPTTIEKAEYGSIVGTVINVSTFPTTLESMQATLQNQQLVKEFTKEGVPIEIRVRLQNDPATFSGLKWSSSKGPNMRVTPGTLATAMVTIRQQAPITLVIPTLKKIFGIV